MSRTAALLFGAAAGAAGTTALNGVTYLDMAIRGRPSSSTPEDTVEKLSDTIGVPVPGDEETRQNRLSGLGPLMGAAAGVAAGAVVGSVLAGRRPGFPVTMAMASGVGMVVGNGPMMAMRITNPARWSLSDWVSDVVPHLAYGAVAAYVLSRGRWGSG